MFATILSAITGLFAPATKLIDKVSTTEQEKLELRNELAKIEAEVSSKMIDLEKKALELEIELRKTELSSPHWIVAAWRPIASLGLISAVVYHSYAGKPMPAEMVNLVEMFLGVHAGGRTIEKVASAIKLGRK